MMEASPTQTYQIVCNTVKPDGPVGGEALVSRPKLTQVGDESKVARTPQHTLCTTVPISHMYGHNYPRTFCGLINR
jgi:hypothetical protein